MDAVPSPMAERALAYPDIAGWPAAVWPGKDEHRGAFVVLLGLLTLVATTFEWSILGAEGWTPLNLLLLLLFTLLFGHVAIGCSQAFFGFLLLSDNPPAPHEQLDRPPQGLSVLPVTAIVVPIYNEVVAPVFARLRVMHDRLHSLGALDRFQFFVLSDSTDRDKAFAEKLAWARLVEETGRRDRFFYRRRKLPLNRKSGNIADFCRRWGSQYRYMICLDADSLMSAATLVELVRRMEENHRIGILQTVPQAINGQTIWSRMQQFSMALYGPIFAAGANFWQQEEGNFWGHNAIVRLGPFMRHCALPQLSGRSAVGRRPMSHDFVEAALMRRAGWEVHLAEDLGGSYEETPPSVSEHLKRDRRWCQGNLQHWPLAFARGFKPVTRFHFLHGIFSFLASPLLVLVLVLGFLKNLGAAPASNGLFADAARAQTALVLFGFTILLLLLPKFLALSLALRNGRAKSFGGAAKLIVSVIVELLLSALIAPVFLFFHAKFVLCSLLGKKVEWSAQQRDCGKGAAWEEARQVFGLTTLLGVGVSALTCWLTPDYFLWLLPVVLGWLLALPLTAFTGDPRIGHWAQRRDLFLVPTELAPPAEVRALRRERRRREPFAGQDLALAGMIDPVAQRLLCLTRSGDIQLHRQIWTTPEAQLPPQWRRALEATERRFSKRPAAAGKPPLQVPGSTIRDRACPSHR